MVHFTLSKHFHVRTNTIAVFTVGIQLIQQNTDIAFQGLLKEHILKQISIKTLGGASISLTGEIELVLPTSFLELFFQPMVHIAQDTL